MKYKTKPNIKEAIQWNGKNTDEVCKFCDNKVFVERRPDGNMIIPTLEGNFTVSKYDYIVKGIMGEFYSVKPDVFEASYEPA